MELKFKKFMEGLADFGFDKSFDIPEKVDIDSNPVVSFDFDRLKKALSERNIGNLVSHRHLGRNIIWGHGAGSIRLSITPQLGVYIDRLGTDLVGESRWYTKKFIQINRDGKGGSEEDVIEHIFSELIETNKMPIDSPSKDFKDIKNLAIEVASQLRGRNPIFIFDKIRKINENRFLVCFNVRGQGVQAPGQKRFESFVIDLNYFPREGYIRTIMNAYSSPLGEHKWEVSVPDANLVFFPTQSKEEIIKPLMLNLKFY